MNKDIQIDRTNSGVLIGITFIKDGGTKVFISEALLDALVSKRNIDLLDGTDDYKIIDEVSDKLMKLLIGGFYD